MWVAGFSGVNCAGLIEAPERMVKPSYDLRFSGVNCAGLIEADPAAERELIEFRVFRR